MRDAQSMKGLDIPKVEPHDKNNCRLCKILKRQSEINKKFFMPSKLNASQKVFWTMRVFIAMGMEMGECQNWMPWKWWKKQQPKANVHEIKFEIIDILHFLVTLALIWGMTCDEVYAFYLAKSEENLDRQRRGY